MIFSEIQESQRCLNNLLLQSSTARALSSGNSALPNLVSVIASWSGDVQKRPFPVDLLVVDVKLLFLITALCQSTR